jgi:hypothetical protein
MQEEHDVLALLDDALHDVDDVQRISIHRIAGIFIGLTSIGKQVHHDGRDSTFPQTVD